jgi:hypothetical protein
MYAYVDIHVKVWQRITVRCDSLEQLEDIIKDRSYHGLYDDELVINTETFYDTEELLDYPGSIEIRDEEDELWKEL